LHLEKVLGSGSAAVAASAVTMFKIPSTIAQDILLIQDLVGKVSKAPPAALPAKSDGALTFNDDSIASSGGEGDSEDEVEADILVDNDGDAEPAPPKQSGLSFSAAFLSSHRDTLYCSGENPESSLDSYSPMASSPSSTSSSDSDADPEDEALPSTNAKVQDVDEDEDEEGGPVNAAPLRTKNELPEFDITVPDIAEIGSDELLEKVGEIMSIVNNVAIVKGRPSQSTNRASEAALDCDTLLVFEDRKVMGYVRASLSLFQPV